MMTTRKIAGLLMAGFLSVQSHARPLLPDGLTQDDVRTNVIWQSVKQLPPEERPKIVLVLGAGGARGLSHVGVLRVLEEEGIPIDQIIGISVGALIGALYAGGVSVDELEQMTAKIGWDSLTDYSKAGIMKLFLANQLLSTERMEDYLEAHLGKRHFSDLAIPFKCLATDIDTGERVVFDKGPVAVAARASATLPGFFKPVQYQNRSLVDGGISDVLPTDLVKSDEDTFVIGVLPESKFEEDEVKSVLSSLVRSIEIQKEVMLLEKKKLADFIIEPHVGAIGVMDISRGGEAVDAGIVEARRSITELKKQILIEMMNKKDEVLGER